MFHAGQHVVCVDAKFIGRGVSPLERGRVYTVSHIGKALGASKYESLTPCWLEVVVLVEVTNIYHMGGDPGFSPHRFRPLSSTRLDVFRQLLVSPEERADA